MTRIRLLKIIFASSLLLIARVVEAAARTHALLVGVAQYPSLDRSLWLEGPRNDVRLFRDFLLERKVKREDIQVLADGVAGAGDPSRSAIFHALELIATRSQRGDFVYLMFAGHGSQQPSKDSLREEPDGLDEIFMPRDIGRWDGEVGAVHNAITDNEIGAAIGRIRARGAFVWAVFDNCHSGTMTRGVPPSGERPRQVLPQQLGVPARILAAALARSIGAGGSRSRGEPDKQPETVGLATDSSGNSGFVAFYAAQSQESTPEALLPLYSPDAVSRGLFSYTLYQVIAAHPNATYRQIIEQVLQTYQGMARQNPTPTYEGSGLDDTIFGAEGGQRVTQWPLDKVGTLLRLRAGLINQVTNNSVLAIVPTPTAKDDEALGYVKVTNATTALSEVVPIAFNGMPLLSLGKLSSATFARPVDLKVDFTLRVSAPVKTDACDTPSKQTSEAVAALRAAIGITPRVRWVPVSEPADVRMCESTSGVLLLDRSGDLAADSRLRPPALVWPKESAAKSAPSNAAIYLSEALEKIGRAANLARLGAAIGSESHMQIELKLRPKCVDKEKSCSTAAQWITPSSRPRVRDGDSILVSVTNPLTQPVDLTVLYVDASYGIKALFPDARQGDLPRVEPLGRVTFPLLVNAMPAGFERLLIIAVPVTPQSPSISFVGLSQAGIAANVKRGGGGGLVEVFEVAAFGTGGQGTTRGALRRPGNLTGSAEITSFGWTVVP